MSDTDQQPVTISRLHRRFRRLIGAAALLGVLALFAALTLWSARPRWYTFVSKPVGTSPPVTLVLRVPVGWECRETKTSFSSILRDVAIRRRPLTGVARWLSEHILHWDRGHKTDEQYAVDLADDSTNWLPLFDSVAQTYKSAGYQVTSRTFEHPLGTARYFKAVWRRIGRPRVGIAALEVTVIAVRQHRHTIMFATHSWVSADSSPFQSTWDEIVRSIRVIQK